MIVTSLSQGSDLDVPDDAAHTGAQAVSQVENGIVTLSHI